MQEAQGTTKYVGRVIYEVKLAQILLSGIILGQICRPVEKASNY
jgi:hypothetical protein